MSFCCRVGGALWHLLCQFRALDRKVTQQMYFRTTLIEQDCTLLGGIYEFLIDLNIRFQNVFQVSRIKQDTLFIPFIEAGTYHELFGPYAYLE